MIVLFLATDTLSVEASVKNGISLENSSKGKEATFIGERGRK